MLEFLGGTYDKQLSIMRREAPRNNLLMRLAGADLGWSWGQRVSSTLRHREACWSIQRRHGVPGSLKPTDTNSDEIKKMKEIILNGWPVNKNETPLCVRQYFTFRGDLTTHEGIIFKGQQAVIPKEIRPNIMRKLHISHDGLKSTLRKVRKLVFWPGLRAQLSEYVENC